MIRKIFPFLRKKETTVEKQNPKVAADFVFQGRGESTSQQIREVGKVLSAQLGKGNVHPHSFGIETHAGLKETEAAFDSIAQKSIGKGERAHLELRVDIDPKQRDKAERLAALAA